MDHGHSFGGDVNYEYLILGAGPAGLQMGHHLSRAGQSYLILEAGDSPGTAFKTFPRHRTLNSTNKVHTGSTDPELNLRFDWNSLLDEDGDGEMRFSRFSRSYRPSADEMVAYLAEYAAHHRLNLRCNTRVLRVEKPHANQFRLTDSTGRVYSCRRLIVATGTSKPYVPEIPGIDQAESYADVSIDPEDFVNQRVLILGKGNSAFETAGNLIPTAAAIHVASPHPLKLAWKTRYAGHLRAANNEFLDTCQLNQGNAVLDCVVERIERRDGQLAVSLQYTRAHGDAEELIYDRVIVATGFRFDDSIFAADCRPELVHNRRFPAQTPEWESINVPGLYFAGTLTQANDFKEHASAFVHGFRYNTRALFRMLQSKHHRREWPARDVEPTPEGLVEATLARLNRSSAAWHQSGFLHDVIVVDEGWDHAALYEEMPLAYIHQSALGANPHYYTITLEAGRIDGDPFAVVRNPEPARADESVFLHPVIRRWSGLQLISERHLLEDRSGEWRKPETHVAPLRYFFMQQLLECAEMESEPRRMLRAV
jgi:thioredoxin reductase